MKFIVRVIFTCLVVSSDGIAACNVPGSLTGTRILAENTQPYSSENPMAGEKYIMHFLDAGKYMYIVLKDNKEYSGEYTYKKLSHDVSVISASSVYGNEEVTYTMTIVCRNNNSGIYFYRQSAGYGGERSNVSRYYIMQNSE